MITRFDHAVIAVQDLDAAIADFARLGFAVAAGGRHPALGTYNAIVRFGLDYLELLAIEEVSLARSRGAFGADLADFLVAGNGAIGFALACTGIDDEARSLARIGVALEGPFAMERQRGDGRTLAWRLLLPGHSPWRKPWPFLIEWATADDERLNWDSPGVHANGACTVRAVELVVGDVDEAARLYEDGLGMVSTLSQAPVGARSYPVGACEVHVYGDRDDAMLDEYTRRGPGPFRLHIGTRSLADSAAWLRRAGVEFVAVEGALDILPSQSQGARLRFVAL